MRAGLGQVAQLAPGHGWASLTAVSSGVLGGPVSLGLRGEVGARLTPWLSGFGYGVGSSSLGGPLGVEVGAGLRATW